MNSTCFSTLSSDCVQLIFDRIPTHHLLFHVRRVSRAWQGHQQLNCRARTTLIILQGNEALRRFTDHIYNEPFIKHNIDQYGNKKNYKFLINHNKVHILPKKCPKADFFTKAFPHLHTLIVSTDRTMSSFLRSLIPLICHYERTLVTLKMYFDGESQVGEQNASVSSHLGKLLFKLNYLMILQHLTFEIADWSMGPWIDFPNYLTRIKEFYFDFVSQEKHMLWHLQDYEKEGNLHKLSRFYSAHHDTALFESLFDDIEKIALADRYAFSPFERHQYKDNEEDLTKIVTKFVSLITFKCSLSTNWIPSFTKLMTILSPLTKLVHLCLEVHNLPTDKPSLNPNLSPQLKSVKALDLWFANQGRAFLSTFYQTQVKAIVQCFPNLQSIRVSTTFESYKDDDDHYKPELDKDEPVQQFFDNLKVAYGRPSLSTKYFAPK